MKHEHPTPYLLRRQDLPPMFHYNCVIDATRRKTIVELQSMTGNALLAYVMKRDDVIDIDSPRDLRVAEALFGRK
jgi:CMP-N-acetylneuraminic acid synthetase